MIYVYIAFGLLVFITIVEKIIKYKNKNKKKPIKCSHCKKELSMSYFPEGYHMYKCDTCNSDIYISFGFTDDEQ